jgi:hypothetical protein
MVMSQKHARVYEFTSPIIHDYLKRLWFDKNIHLLWYSISVTSSNRLEISFYFRPFAATRPRIRSPSSLFQTSGILIAIVYPGGIVVFPAEING